MHIDKRLCASFSLWNSPHHGRPKTIENKGSNIRYNKIHITFSDWVIVEKIISGNVIITFPGWVVTWFLLGYTVRMFEYTVRTFWSNVGRFLYVFSSIPRKLYTIFQPTFSPIKRYQVSIFKLLTFSTNSVTNVVRTAYFQIQAWSSPLKILWQSLYSK